MLNQYLLFHLAAKAMGSLLYPLLDEGNFMRLTQRQIEVLKRTAKEVFGANAGLMLFGSRVDENLSGGDIDLYITGFNQPTEQQLDAKLRFLVKVKREIGEQRIDLVFAPLQGQAPLPIQRIAEQTGISL